MRRSKRRPQVGKWGSLQIAPGDNGEVQIAISESYSGMSLSLPVYVRRGREPGPTVFVTGAVHGDEINGTGTIRQLIIERDFHLRSGALILVPVVNLLGFERYERYLPDRRDLNRSFPGTRTGSLASRQARAIMDQVVARSDYGIDLHTAAVRRTNFPNIRAEMENPELAPLARAFGTELIVSGKGPKGSLRAAATQAGCPTMVFEAGETWKVERTVVEYALRGIRNCLVQLGMVEGAIEFATYQFETDTTTWIRARKGGFLQFHVTPGDVVDKGQPIATNTSLMGRKINVVTAPRSGIILGMTTIPSVAPGDPICHLSFTREGGLLRKAEHAQQMMSHESLHERAREDISSSMLVRDSSDSDVEGGA